jgi:hypothetical protein
MVRICFHLRPVLFFLFLTFFLILISCKRDTSTYTEEEQAYLADYESPDAKWGFVDTEGNLVIEAEYDDVGPFTEGLAAVNKDGRWGFIDRTGNVVIQPVYKSVWAFHEGFARVESFDQPGHYINKGGTALSSVDWEAADNFSEGRAKVKVGHTYGFIDASGTLVVESIYSRAFSFENGVCVVEFEDKQGVIDPAGQPILKTEFDQVKVTNGGNTILARKGNVAIAYDMSGKELLNMSQVKMVDSDGEVIAFQRGDNMYLVIIGDKSEMFPSYTNILYLGDKLWAGKTQHGYVLMNNKGIPLSNITYSQINKFSDGLAAYSKNETWGYLDAKGKKLTEEGFGLAWDYREGFARAAFKDGIAFLDKNQQLAFYPPRGTIDMRDFSEGLASVQIE